MPPATRPPSRHASLEAGFNALVSLLARLSRRSRQGLGLFILLAGLGFTLGGAWFVAVSQAREAQRRFDTTANRVEMAFRSRFQGYAEALKGSRAFLETTSTLDRETFEAYCSRLALQERLPGIMGITYGVHMPPDTQHAWTLRLRQQWENLLPEPFHIHPDPQGREAYVVIYGYPRERNRPAIGYDSTTLPVQVPSLRAALESREIAASGPLPLAQAPGAGPGVLLRLGVRRPQGLAYLNTAFLVDGLVQSALRDLSDLPLNLTLEDVNGTTRQPLWERQTGSQERVWGKPIEATRTLDIGHRIWSLHLTSGGGCAPPSARWLPGLCFAGGSLLSLLVAGLVGTLDRLEHWASDLAESRLQALEAGERRLTAIARVLPDLVVVLDGDGRVLEAMGGRSFPMDPVGTDFRGQPVEKVFPTLAPHLRDLSKQTLSTGSPQIGSFHVESGGFHIEGVMAPAFVRQSEPLDLIWMGRDITAQHEEEQRLREVQKLESLGLLASGIAHDFNNLLNATRLNLALVREDAEAGEPIGTYLEAAEASIDSAAELARQMMTYAGKHPVEAHPFHLNTLMDEMSRLLKASLSRKAEITWTLAPDLPPLEGDRVQVSQVLLNLLVNASDAMADTAGTIQVTSRLDAGFRTPNHMAILPAPAGRAIFLEVRDTGCGMSAEVLARIFDPFFTTKATGRGLGLSAMLGILRAHGAGLAVSSTPGVGTTFELAFPVADLA